MITLTVAKVDNNIIRQLSEAVRPYVTVSDMMLLTVSLGDLCAGIIGHVEQMDK